MGIDIFSFVVIILFGSTLAYKISFLHKKSVWHLSWLQVLYLVIIPGFLFVLGYSYMQSILARPAIEKPFLSDELLSILILLSILFTYGGLTMHAVTKMLGEKLTDRQKDSEFGRINTFFKLNFSHNLIYSGIILIMLGFVLLEMNHVSNGGVSGLWGQVIKGFLLGLSLVLGMYFYTIPRGIYSGRWADLKAVFFVFWLGSILLLYGAKKVSPAMRDYDLLIPAVASFAIIAALNVALVFRRLKSGGVQSYFSWKRLLKGENK